MDGVMEVLCDEDFFMNLGKSLGVAQIVKVIWEFFVFRSQKTNVY